MRKQLITVIAVCVATLLACPESRAASSGKCGENLTWTLDDEGNLKITGSGPMQGYGINGPWGRKVKSVTMSGGVTSIGSKAFGSCYDLTSVGIPNSVKIIGGAAFLDCKKLGNVTLPNELVTIEGAAFNGCKSLKGIKIPNSVTSFGRGVFSGCDSLATVSVDMKIIPDNAFDRLTGLKSVTMGGSVDTIGSYAFGSCRALTDVAIGGSVRLIGNSAFSDCDSLKSITIPQSVESIGNNAFSYCTGMTNATIGNSVKEIGNYAFNTCSAMTDLTIGYSVETIGNGAFDRCSALTSIVVYAVEPPKCNGNVFYGVDTKTCVLRVPKQSMDKYKSTYPWSLFFNTTENEGVEDVISGWDVRVRVADGAITVDGVAADAVMEVYGVGGASVYRGAVRAVAVPTPGVYIVRVAGVTAKVAVR